LIIALAKAKAEGKTIDSLIARLPPLVEECEYRFKIGTEDFNGASNYPEQRRIARRPKHVR